MTRTPHEDAMESLAIRLTQANQLDSAMAAAQAEEDE